jgi:hypothetical protein
MILVCSTPHIVSAKSKGPMILVCSTPHIVSAKRKGPMILVCSTPHIVSAKSKGPMILVCSFRIAYIIDTSRIHLFDHLQAQTSKGLYTSIFIDLQKAFNDIDHKFIYTKLQPIRKSIFQNIWIYCTIYLLVYNYQHLSCYFYLIMV